MFSLSLLNKNRIKNGRLFVYEKDTTDLAPVFTYENAEYTEAPNPIYCVNGLAENTYFLENRIYDVLVQEYEGESTDPKGDLRTEVWRESFSTKVGFEFDKEQREANRVTVHTIENLKNLPVGGYVDVIGYWTDDDCEARTYAWDPYCVNTEDGGLIIGSDQSDNGRWILICNEIMKSEYYGVYGNNHQEHLGSLFSYNDTYGSLGIVSPKTIYLAPGSYGDGYSLYNARGKKVVFSYGAKLRNGNTLRCMNFEGIGTSELGALQIGFNENGQWSEDRANQPVRLSQFPTLDAFLNSWSKNLIFDKEGDVAILNSKTLENCYVTFEKEINIISNTSNNPATIYFDNCTIVSDHKILDGTRTHFKNMYISDKWFKRTFNTFIPNAEEDVNVSSKSKDFDKPINYWKVITLYKPSAVTADFAGMDTGEDTSTFTSQGLSSCVIRNYNGKYITVGSEIPSVTLENCYANSAYVYSPKATFNNCHFKYGSLNANGLGGRIDRCYENCVFSNEVKFGLENATAFGISAINCDFGWNNTNPFISQNGLDVGQYPNQRGRTFFKNNIGLGDNNNPTAYFSGINSNPKSIINGELVWDDAVGSWNFNNGWVSYSLEPFVTDKQSWRWDLNASVQTNLYEPIMKAPDITYKWDFVHGADGKVYNAGVISMSAEFEKPYMLYNPSTQNLGKIYLIRHTR